MALLQVGKFGQELHQARSPLLILLPKLPEFIRAGGVEMVKSLLAGDP